MEGLDFLVAVGCDEVDRPVAVESTDIPGAVEGPFTVIDAMVVDFVFAEIIFADSDLSVGFEASAHDEGSDDIASISVQFAILKFDFESFHGLSTVTCLFPPSGTLHRAHWIECSSTKAVYVECYNRSWVIFRLGGWQAKGQTGNFSKIVRLERLVDECWTRVGKRDRGNG